MPEFPSAIHALRSASRGCAHAAILCALALLGTLCAARPAGADAVVAAPPPIDASVERLRAHVDRLRVNGRVTIGAEEIVSHVALPLVYEDAGFRLLWSTPAAVDSLLAGLRGLESDGLRPADYHYEALVRLRGALAAATTPELAADFDLLASDAFVLALYHLYLGKVDPLALEASWNFGPRPLQDRRAVAFVREAIASGRLVEALDSVRPTFWLYESGRRALAQYRAIAARGGWENVPAGPALAPGADDPRVPALRRRLAVSGDYVAAGSGVAAAGAVAPSDASTLYDEPLVAAVHAFQSRRLLAPDGRLGAATLRELNVPVGARIDQLRINLERGRWVLHEIGDGDLVVVDVAGYGVRYLRDRRVIWQARAIVGKPFRQTPVFRADIQYVVFNPTWTVPPTILAEDVLPAMRRGDDVLTRKQLGVYDREGRRIDPATLDWAHYTPRNFPYFLRQEAGDDNALGRVKIMFPNPHSVYLHDTPSRALFERDERTFSSGCIRVERPLELVRLLLADETRWNERTIGEVVATGATRTVMLPKRIPVLLIYWTADQDDAGRIVFKRDVYGRDPKLLRALDDRFAFGTRARA